ncbi:hypothetical protein SLOPH_2283 [Spraguea lophii 42_110]|uniref:Uncharacterized protein n=1 Tax=Spraguea lophii (strain 42_110) TaxID=1358809 RepID=S7W5Q0_SPRLO|nr:hypothetical protein SLOPH_2283 [Spraguea lophii 42_110]
MFFVCDIIMYSVFFINVLGFQNTKEEEEVKKDKTPKLILKNYDYTEDVIQMKDKILTAVYKVDAILEARPLTIYNVEYDGFKIDIVDHNSNIKITGIDHININKSNDIEVLGTITQRTSHYRIFICEIRFRCIVINKGIQETRYIQCILPPENLIEYKNNGQIPELDEFLVLDFAQCNIELPKDFFSENITDNYLESYKIFFSSIAKIGVRGITATNSIVYCDVTTGVSDSKPKERAFNKTFETS